MVRTNSDNPDFKTLTARLDEELCRIYGTNQADYEEYNKITDLPTVIIAYANNIPVGCGCFKIYDESTVELKRMFVEPELRGKGIASAIVKELERWALELGYNSIILETGNKQPEAINMYHKLGYQDTEKYGQYEDAVLSVCMKKQLG
jgi:GNAT superfamily N-acetyltransferase